MDTGVYAEDGIAAGVPTGWQADGEPAIRLACGTLVPGRTPPRTTETVFIPAAAPPPPALAPPAAPAQPALLTADSAGVAQQGLRGAAGRVFTRASGMDYWCWCRGALLGAGAAAAWMLWFHWDDVRRMVQQCAAGFSRKSIVAPPASNRRPAPEARCKVLCDLALSNRDGQFICTLRRGDHVIVGYVEGEKVNISQVVEKIGEKMYNSLGEKMANSLGERGAWVPAWKDGADTLSVVAADPRPASPSSKVDEDQDDEDQDDEDEDQEEQWGVVVEHPARGTAMPTDESWIHARTVGEDEAGPGPILTPPRQQSPCTGAAEVPPSRPGLTSSGRSADSTP